MNRLNPAFSLSGSYYSLESIAHLSFFVIEARDLVVECYLGVEDPKRWKSSKRTNLGSKSKDNGREQHKWK
ncbi:hypothetical protein QN277_015377 [Acacia crassicarpa]|uniref:Uncharacterized protein n=1 Tax=Acacia crassicarpa TaxID=499986 RepID=A0AAE1JZQ8_9FABA|nr:hypothetical protein QN277_015377 [Acacia crassicarpa]